MTKNSLKSMPYAQACVLSDTNGNQELVSYTTTVLNLTADGWLTVYGLYSMTTRKHISAFMRENNSNYQVAKTAYETGNTINIYTGEIKM